MQITKEKCVINSKKKICRKKINRRNLRKLPSASEIELNRIQFTMSSDNDYDSIFDASDV